MRVTSQFHSTAIMINYAWIIYMISVIYFCFPLPSTEMEDEDNDFSIYKLHEKIIFRKFHIYLLQILCSWKNLNKYSLEIKDESFSILVMITIKYFPRVQIIFKCFVWRSARFYRWNLFFLSTIIFSVVNYSYFYQNYLHSQGVYCFLNVKCMS